MAQKPMTTIILKILDPTTLLIASVFFIFAAGLYLSGALNPYSIAIRKMKKQLKAYPKVPSFKEWSKPADKDDNE